MTETKTFSSGDAFRFGWNAFQANMGTFIIVGIISLVGSMIPIVSIVVGIVIHLGVITVGLKLVGGAQKVTVEDFFSNYRLFFSYLLASVLVGVISGIGFLLLIIPGIIACVGLQFFGYFIVERNAGPVDSLKQSWELTKGVRWNLFVFGLLVIGLNILGAIALLIGLIATIPTSMVATAYVYRKLSGGSVTVPTAPAPAPAA